MEKRDWTIVGATNLRDEKWENSNYGEVSSSFNHDSVLYLMFIFRSALTYMPRERVFRSLELRKIASVHIIYRKISVLRSLIGTRLEIRNLLFNTSCRRGGGHNWYENTVKLCHTF